MSNSPPIHFDEDMAKRYDERNSKFAPISDCLHFLTRLVLDKLPAKAHVLCVGVGTGAELLMLAQARPEWTFVGVDPSLPMVEVCRQRAAKAGIADRCELVQGYVQDLSAKAEFDAALSFLVAHFVPRAERIGFIQNMTKRLRPGGHLVTAEISYDLDSNEYPAMLENWTSMQGLTGGNAESLASLPKILKETLSVLSPSETERIWREAGITCPIRFFQALMIHGWHGKKA